METSGSAKYFVAMVDDEPRIHEALVSMLTEAGLLKRHVAFSDPLGFLAFLKEGQDIPDLVLLDVHFENSGLTGVEILPFIREDHPYLPVILFTGMDDESVMEAQSFPCTYFIPKPIDQNQLSRMIRFYMGKSRKSGELIEKLTGELGDSKQYLEMLEEELAKAQAAPQAAAEPGDDRKGTKPFEKIKDLLTALLSGSEITPSFVEDLEHVFKTQYNLFKKVIEVLVRFDVAETSTPGLDVHKHKGVEDIYSARLNVKVRLYYYKSTRSTRKKLLRLDTVHDTKGIDKWLKNSYKSYADQ